MLKSKRRTGATQILSRLFSTTDKSLKISGGRKNNEFLFTLANSLETRRSAYRLSQKIYAELGYVDALTEYDVHDYDADPDTFTLIARDQEQNGIATISVIFERDKPLPCYEDFSEEMMKADLYGKKTAEVVRLAISPTHRDSSFLLFKMFNLMYLYTYYILKHSNLVIEVSKAHAKFYERLLSFETLGQIKPCTRVNGNPSNLLYLNLTDVEKYIAKSRDPLLSKKCKRNFMNYCVNSEMENEILQYFLETKKPMSNREKAYFGITQSDLDINEDELEFSIF